uniref:Lipocalin n=1 Tax=Rhipicephalus zambeziensis TaxID=60191 RepID=A0A224YC23_9ACAR
MNILGLLALHSFVCTVIGGGPGGGAPTAQPSRKPVTSIFDTPLGRKEPVYLVGYSADLNTSSHEHFMRCVHSNYTKTYGSWVKRLLLSEYKNAYRGDNVPGPLPIYVNMTILENSPDVLTLNVTVSLNVTTGAKSSYEIKHSDDNSIVLAERGSSRNAEKALCSLWVTGNYTAKEQIPSQANTTFYNECQDPVYDAFPEYCFHLQ